MRTMNESLGVYDLLNDMQHSLSHARTADTLPAILADLDHLKHRYLTSSQIVELQDLGRLYGVEDDNFLNHPPYHDYMSHLKGDFIEKLKGKIKEKIEKEALNKARKECNSTAVGQSPGTTSQQNGPQKIIDDLGGQLAPVLSYLESISNTGNPANSLLGDIKTILTSLKSQPGSTHVSQTYDNLASCLRAAITHLETARQKLRAVSDPKAFHSLIQDKATIADTPIYQIATLLEIIPQLQAQMEIRYAQVNPPSNTESPTLFSSQSRQSSKTNTLNISN